MTGSVGLRPVLLGLTIALLTVALQGVQGEEQSDQVPSEVQCRPYIEKALKDREAGSIEESKEDTKEDIVEEEVVKVEVAVPPDSKEDDSKIDDKTDEIDDDAKETVEIEDEKESGEVTADVIAEIKEESVEDVAGDDDSKEKEKSEVGDSGEDEHHAEDVSGEQQTESTEAQSVEDDTQKDDEKDESEEKPEETKDESDEVVEEVQAESTETKEKDTPSEEKPEEDEVTEEAEKSGEDKSVEEVADKKEEEEDEEEEGDSKEETVEEQGDSKEEATEEQGESKEEAADEKDDSKEETAEAAESVEAEEVKEGSESAEAAEAKEGESAEAEEAKEGESAEAEEGAGGESAEGEESKEGGESAGTESDREGGESVEEAESANEGGESVEETGEATATGESVEEAVDTKEGDESVEEVKSREKREVGDAPGSKEEEEQGESEEKTEDGKDDESEEGEEKGEEESTESTPEEELIQEIEIPENLRPRDHINQILRLDEDNEVKEAAIEKAADVILKELKRLYDNAIKPLETLYKYRDLSNRHFGDPEIFSKPLVLFMGPWSGGKSSIINYLLDTEYKPTALRTGAEPSPAYFNIVMHGEEEEVLDGTQLAADWTFSGLQKFGQGMLDRLRGLKLTNKLLEKVNIVEIPGILEIRKQVQRLFPFNDACQWFIDRADIIFLVYDPSKLDVGPETEAILDQLKGREYQTRIILNKADQVKPEELMRVQGALIWNISPLMSSAEPPIMYSTSLWSLPYEAGAPTRLLYAQERAFLRDLRSAIEKRVEHKIASARRFAVRVRNHAKMVDCYLTTYYNHKTFFGNKKEISDKIIDNPQDYHIYEGLSTLTNISRYDLPDPDVYRDFFRLNPLYDFQSLSSTCTYFRGCPINRLDVAIAYDLPELVGKYKKLVEAAIATEEASHQPSTS